MSAFLYKSDDLDEQAEERRAAVKMMIEAMVSARHAEVMDLYGLPRDFFAPLEVEILDPVHPSAHHRARGAKPQRGSAKDSVLRGKVVRTISSR
jgi:hypothetical protein